MNWFKKATTLMKLDWDTAYRELLKELGRKPTNEEVRRRMHDDSDISKGEFNPIDFDSSTDYDDLPF